MSFGLQNFDNAGLKTLDTDSFLTRYLVTVNIRGSIDYSMFPKTGSVNVPELAGVTRYWWTYERTPGSSFYINTSSGTALTYQMPNISISGTTLSWYYQGGGGSSYVLAPTTVIFGIY